MAEEELKRFFFKEFKQLIHDFLKIQLPVEVETVLMESVQNRVYYCCVLRSDRILYKYSNGDQELEKLAALCLEKAPPFHTWYFQTIRKRSYGFLMEDGYVYFTIVDEGLGNPGVLQFLEHVRDEFKKVAKKGSKGSISSLNSIRVQEQLLPVIRRLITSLEHVSPSGNSWNTGLSPSPSNANGQIEVANSTKAPLLGKPSKMEKKKMKDHGISMRDIELEQHRKSTDRGVRVDSGSLETSNQDLEASSLSLHKDLSSTRIKPVSQNIRKKWCRQVRIILAIDAAVCVILFVIWLCICHGIECIN